ncbi:3-deoxy-D-manno-octulosonic acid transferase [Hyphomonas sp. WL0036]|uniref:3-deoxy-D-manno-octulosonic acid transferase n=1 Tax=Hyphomonas sediminis TaxID=2866160 RepID=UPI001C81F07E|nr:glycosyltransferase N-terminal domain-containing protein [Hyphomonas sediminis]MBY9065336.1 3-deoxy-D-manno-octulosonic acid transferase [Hyphomonas sediminis]
MTPALFAYRLATYAASPFLGFVLSKRAKDGKEDYLRLHERYAKRLPPRRPGPLVWLHGASVGESSLLLELGRRLIAERPGVMLVFTSQTVTSARLLGPLLPDNAIHAMAPLDTPQAARRFIQHWKPDLCVFAEGEIWPNLIHEARKNGARTALVNARMTQKSADGWQKVRGLFRQLVGGFEIVLAADLDTGQRLESLLGRAVRAAGNLKSALPPPAANDVELTRLTNNFIAGRRCLVAASTHPGEEEIFLDAAATLDEDVALIIAPRHPDRGDEIEALLKKRNLRHARRSKGVQSDKRDRVLLADTMGEMGTWLRMANAVYLGGGHAEGVGGHNPLEPIRLHRPVASGPRVHNFADLMASLEASGLVNLVADTAALAAFFKETPPVPDAALAALAAEADQPMLVTLGALLPLVPRPLLEASDRQK